MRRIFTVLVSAFLLIGAASAQSMSDEQVIAYVKSGQQQGKSQQQLVTELSARGVTKAQVERIKAKYEESQSGAGANASVETQRARRTQSVEDGVSTTFLKDINSEIEANDTAAQKQIFGKNIFTNKNLTFEPNLNMATPQNYKLGPGDEVIIDVWGASENSIRETISPEGSITVSTLGPVYLSGMTVNEANAFLQREFSKIYSGIQGNTSQVKLTLGQIRTILVNMMGEVAVPGTYRLSSFSSVFHALYRAGGVNNIGSLRNIQVVRNGRPIADIDVYDYLLHGKMNDNIRLMEGDVIVVPPYDNLVEVSGKVKRPMYYEMKKGETVETLLNYAGGFTGDAYNEAVRLLRMSGREKQIYNVDKGEYAAFPLMDNDALSVGAVLDRFGNRAEVKGAVYRDGMYQINGSVNTVKQLIEKAEGLRGDAFMTRAQLQRENDDLTLTMIPLDLQGIMNGSAPDVVLQRNDVLYIPSIHDLTEQGTLTISGQVARPGTFPFADNMTIEDLVLKAGGLLESASTARVDVARRIKNPGSTTETGAIGEVFTFELKNGYVVNGPAEFTLEPFDQVYIRRSPGYHEQQNVAVAGEVLFGGLYAMTIKTERLSDLIKKAGGVTPEAYVKGARLVRRMTLEEVKRRDDVLRLTANGTGKDSISVETLDLSQYYSVGIDLQMALNNPGTDYDLVLRAGDMLYVPEYNNTVKINGAVMYPNTVVYKAGANLKYYINQAGGYGNNAKKKKAYVVYMNGTVSRLRWRNAKQLAPGCEIIVPTKAKRDKMSAGEIMGLSSTGASMAAVVASMINLFK